MLAGLAIFVFLATTRATRDEVRRRVGVIGAAADGRSGYALVQAAGLDRSPGPRTPACTLAPSQ
jgi:hypothetical protein